MDADDVGACGCVNICEKALHPKPDVNPKP